jgi:hypothetical protein
MILRSSFLLLLQLPWFVACSTPYEWREMQSGSATRAEVFQAIDTTAQTDGYMPGSGCDRGMGLWESKWRYRQLGLGRPGRFRLLVELLLDDGSTADGWTVRYRIEQQMVDDLRRSMDPLEDDWESAGQDFEREELFGERLRMRLNRGESGPGATGL